MILPSDIGRIETILLVFPGIATQAHWTEYESVLKIFEPRSKVVIFKHEDPGLRIKISYQSVRGRGNISPAPLFLQRCRDIHCVNHSMSIKTLMGNWEKELTEIAENRPLSYPRWAQDPFCALTDGDHTILLQSMHTHRIADLFLALHLAEDASLRAYIKPTRLALEGGNILATQGKAYIGRDLIHANQQFLQVSEQEVISRLQADLGCSSIIPVGYESPRRKLLHLLGVSRQPLFHIDLFITLGGLSLSGTSRLIFIASPSITAELLKSLMASSPTYKDILTLPSLEEIAYFDDLRFNFIDGEELIDLPIFFHQFRVYSWNNVLVEVIGAQRRVFVPSYIAEIDHELLNPVFRILETAVQDAYASQGFEVVWLRAGGFFRVLAGFGGSLHCAVKVLKRSSIPANASHIDDSDQPPPT